MSETDGIESNAFEDNDIPSIQLIVQMRIYDVLMAIYTHLDKGGAERLYELHKDGKILGTLPYLNLSPEDFDS